MPTVKWKRTRIILDAFDAAGRLASRTAVQPTGTLSQVTGYVYGISPATGSTIASNDILAETRYPDPATGVAAASERDTYTSNALGERTKFNDRAGTAHTYTFDGRRRPPRSSAPQTPWRWWSLTDARHPRSRHGAGIGESPR